jgi:hypothetical protein
MTYRPFVWTLGQVTQVRSLELFVRLDQGNVNWLTLSDLGHDNTAYSEQWGLTVHTRQVVNKGSGREEVAKSTMGDTRMGGGTVTELRNTTKMRR